MKLHVLSYITGQIQAKPKPRARDNSKVKPTVYGEVLTSDEVVSRLEEEQERQIKAAEKAKKAADREAKKQEAKKAQKAKKDNETSMQK